MGLFVVCEIGEMMELTDRDKAIINDLVQIAWQAGAIRAPQQAQEIEMLRAKILAKPKEQPKEDQKL